MGKAGRSDNDVAIVRITETAKVIRWASGCLFAAFCIWQARVGFSDYLKTRPNTSVAERVISVIVTAVVTLAVPGGLTYYLWKRVKAFTKFAMARLARLEAERDPSRGSSGLLEDGSDPPGATP